MRPGAMLPEALARRTLASVDPNLPIMRMQSLSQQVASTFSQQRLIARLTSLFGILALVLASVGVYGMVIIPLTKGIGDGNLNGWGQGQMILANQCSSSIRTIFILLGQFCIR
jgi:hypothetical protein